MTEYTSEEKKIDPVVRRNAFRDVILYGIARLFLFVVLTIVISFVAGVADAPLPLIMSALFALLIAFPLSMFVFKGLRVRATEGIGLWNSQRKARKEWVKKELQERQDEE
ncbi:MAG: DUF4229 domain-containing protein [Corynebacterium sp.]|nr:DUF4229 domain-containing protein [Corynebacterium sp.]